MRSFHITEYRLYLRYTSIPPYWYRTVQVSNFTKGLFPPFDPVLLIISFTSSSNSLFGHSLSDVYLSFPILPSHYIQPVPTVGYLIERFSKYICRLVFSTYCVQDHLSSIYIVSEMMIIDTDMFCSRSILMYFGHLQCA